MTNHGLPSVYYFASRSGWSGSKFEAYIEYVLEASLICPGATRQRSPSRTTTTSLGSAKVPASSGRKCYPPRMRRGRRRSGRDSGGSGAHLRRPGIPIPLSWFTQRLFSWNIPTPSHSGYSWSPNCRTSLLPSARTVISPACRLWRLCPSS